MAIPEEEEHKKIIEKNIKTINTFILVSIFLLICILVFNKNNNSNNDCIYIFFILVFNLSTLYFCNINWSQIGLVSIHYIYIIVLFISIFCNNICIITYFIFVVILNMYIWYINTDCIFGGLNWGSENIHKIGEFCMMGLPLIYIFKFIKLFNSNSNIESSNTNLINPFTSVNIINMGDIGDIIENGGKIIENELFEILHKKFS